MADERGTIEFTVDGQTISALTAGPRSCPGRPLIAALHGGTYNARYFDVAGSRHGSFMDLAAGLGYCVVSLDRPGYGGSSALEPDDNTFDRHARLLAAAVAQAAESYGADGVVLLGHSIGGMIAAMIAAADIDFRRAQVGDRHVLSMLKEAGGVLGGETSGHILCLDKTTTGDGLISALQVLAVMQQSGAQLAELSSAMPRYPQVLLNVRVEARFDPLSEPAVVAVVENLERRFLGKGRIVLRASGTEPLIRVMVEGYDAALVKQGAAEIAAAVGAAAKAR